MKVLYFHQHFSTPNGAAGTRSYEMARNLVSKGHDVTMVCGSYQGGQTGVAGQFENNRRQAIVDGINVIEFNLGYSNKDGFIKRTLTFFKFALSSILIALRSDYDLVFATSTPLTAAIPGILAKIVRRKPFVFEVRDLWPELPREMGVITNRFILRLMSWLEWSAYHSADKCIGLSPGIVKGIESRNISEDKVVMIPNGCDLDIFNVSKTRNKESDQFCRPEGVSRNDLMAVFTGSHGLANGLDAILDGAEELKRRGRNDIKLVFVGDGKLKSGLKTRVQEQGLDNCIFLDPLPKHALSILMSEADLGIMALANVPAFYYGTSPNKFFDYLAAGLPVINNYPGWVADIVTQNKCGLVVDPDNPAGLASGFEDLADNRESLVQMGECSRAVAESMFDRVVLASQFANCLEAVLSDC